MDQKDNDIIGFGDSERCIEIPWALSNYSNEQTVLDIGYANAEDRYIQALLSLKIPYLHGLDISDKPIEGIISHVGDIRNTIFEDNFFDLVFCISTIEHIGRDNSVYKNNFVEDIDNGDLDALKEIYRITKNDGKIVITIPYGKFFNYGWFIQYDEKRLKKLLNSSPFEILKKEFFIYENGWHKCYEKDLTSILYKDNNAPAAAGLVCLLLKKRARFKLSIQKEEENNNYKEMTENPKENRDDEINVEEIMAKIREDIRKKQVSGELPQDPFTSIESPLLNFSHCQSKDMLDEDLLSLKTHWDLNNNSYSICSHHPVYGKILVKGRELVHGEVRRYVDPVISRQKIFNKSATRVLYYNTEKCETIASQLDGLRRKIAEYDQKIQAEINKQTVIELARFHQQYNMKKNQSEFFKSHDDHESQADGRQLNPQSPDTGINYLLFEEQFRGSRESIKKRQREFIPYFKNCTSVLDIGCGRGEFLEILDENGIGGKGIDLDTDMINYCKAGNLNVELADAVSYLEQLDDSCLDGIFMDQVVEHLEPTYLVRLLNLCYHKLKTGSYLVVETVNPLSLTSFINFYIDHTHKKPLHPDTLEYLFRISGFIDLQKQFFSPIPDEQKLIKLTIYPDAGENQQKNIIQYNSNIDVLNSILFGMQDYAVIGKK